MTTLPQVDISDGVIWETYQQTGPDGIIWHVHDFSDYEVWQPQLPPGPDGFRGTDDDPVEYPAWLPGGPPPRVKPQGLPARRVLQVPSFEYGKPALIASYNDIYKAGVVTVATDRKPPGWLADPRYPLVPKGRPGRPTTQSPSTYKDATTFGASSGKSPVTFIGLPFPGTDIEGHALGLWIPVPVPNPFYFFGDRTDIEEQKQQIQNYFNGSLDRLHCYGYPLKDNKFLIFDSDAAANRIAANQEHCRLAPELVMGCDDLWLLGMQLGESGPGHRGRLVNQFLANAIHNGWTPYQTIQLWRGFVYSSSKFERVDLRPADARPGKTMPPKQAPPPGWQGPWPGDWQGHLDRLQREYPPLHPQVLEIPPACQSGPAPPPTQPPSNIRYVCKDGGCIVSLSGVGYATQAECEQVCELPPNPDFNKWSCINGQCQQIPQGGQYNTRRECQEAGCGQSEQPPPGPQPPPIPPGPQPPSIRYGCVNGVCQQVGLSGPYATLAECKQAGCEQPQSRWFCESGECVERQGTGLQGGFKTKGECVSNCAPVVRWECRNGQCISHINDGFQGGFKTRKECEDGCSQSGPPPPPPQPPPPPPPIQPIRYGCVNGSCQQVGLTGPYATLAECLQVGCGPAVTLGWACTPSGNCEQVINGPYASRALCEAQCAKPQNCDPCKEIADIKRRLPPESQPYSTSPVALCMFDRSRIIIKQDTQ